MEHLETKDFEGNPVVVTAEKIILEDITSLTRKLIGRKRYQVYTVVTNSVGEVVKKPVLSFVCKKDEPVLVKTLSIDTGEWI